MRLNCKIIVLIICIMVICIFKDCEKVATWVYKKV